MKFSLPEKIALALTGATLCFMCGLFAGRQSFFQRPFIHRPTSASVSHATSSPSENQTRVNINTADRQTLMTLPGIGEMLADRILAYREEAGPFSVVEELLDVPGIGDATMEILLHYVFVEG